MHLRDPSIGSSCALAGGALVGSRPDSPAALVPDLREANLCCSVVDVHVDADHLSTQDSKRTTSTPLLRSVIESQPSTSCMETERHHDAQSLAADRACRLGQALHRHVART